LQVLDGFDDAGAPRLRPPRRAITLRRLLTHTAGFAYPAFNEHLLRWQQHTGGAVPWQQCPLVFDPGERWEYGTGLRWVGRLVEHASGRSLEDYFRGRILDPLGLADTSFVPGPDQRVRLASPHQRLSDGSLRAVEATIPGRSAELSTAQCFSTGPDYLRFLRMLLGGGQLDGARLLQPETVTEMARNQIGELTVGALRSLEPNRSNDVEFFPGMVKKWGLGGLINTERAPTGRSANSWAWAGVNNTYFWVDPTRRVAGVLLTQLLPFCDPAVLDLFARFEHAVYASRG
ncbi:MAG: beta-lactamase family protein, partial [Chloroflexota bacterium]|nr:beta-lactamase family protein [Chloroflexota bacterium]